MRDLKRILELRFENHSQREIARMLKVSRNTVRDVFDAKRCRRCLLEHCLQFK